MVGIDDMTGRPSPRPDGVRVTIVMPPARRGASGIPLAGSEIRSLLEENPRSIRPDPSMLAITR